METLYTAFIVLGSVVLALVAAVVFLILLGWLHSILVNKQKMRESNDQFFSIEEMPMGVKFQFLGWIDSPKHGFLLARDKPTVWQRSYWQLEKDGPPGSLLHGFEIVEVEGKREIRSFDVSSAATVSS